MFCIERCCAIGFAFMCATHTANQTSLMGKVAIERRVNLIQKEKRKPLRYFFTSYIGDLKFETRQTKIKVFILKL